MIEQGVVVSLNNEIATVQMEKGEKCQNCTVCDSMGTEFRTLEAVNRPGAQIGDRVEVEIKAANVLLYSFLLFIFPILLMITGYFTGTVITGNGGAKEGSGVAGSILGLVIAFVFVKIYANKIKGDKKIIAYVNHIITTE